MCSCLSACPLWSRVFAYQVRLLGEFSQMRCRGMTPSPTPIPSTYRRDSRGPTAWVGDQVDVDIPGTNQRGAANGQRAPVVVFVSVVAPRFGSERSFIRKWHSVILTWGSPFPPQPSMGVGSGGAHGDQSCDAGTSDVTSPTMDIGQLDSQLTWCCCQSSFCLE